MSGEPRDAATTIAARPGPGGPEVVVVERAGASRFLPGYVVFPGGAVEPRDRDLAERWFGTADEALRACAVRELAEEAGLALTAEGLRSAGAADRLAAVDASPPSVDRLRLISHWVAPATTPIRFNVRFFAVVVPRGVDPLADGHEATRAWWTRPADLLADWDAGRVRLFWPTMKMLEALSGFRSAEEVLAARVPQVEPARAMEEGGMPRSTFDPWAPR